jgi:hypothetical protein
MEHFLVGFAGNTLCTIGESSVRIVQYIPFVRDESWMTGGRRQIGSTLFDGDAANISIT